MADDTQNPNVTISDQSNMLDDKSLEALGVKRKVKIGILVSIILLLITIVIIIIVATKPGKDSMDEAFVEITPATITKTSDGSSTSTSTSDSGTTTSTTTTTDSSTTLPMKDSYISSTGVVFKPSGNTCARGFVVTLRNKKDLYNFSAMEPAEEKGLTQYACQEKCSEKTGCEFYQFTETYGTD